MAGYATKIIAIMADIKAAVEGITAANGYDVAVRSATADAFESPFDRSTSEFPRAYVYVTPGTDGNVTRIDDQAWEASWAFAVDTWVLVQDTTDLSNLPKYAAAVMHAVEAWRLTDSIGAEMDIEPTTVSYWHMEKKRSVIRVAFDARVRFLRTDR